MLITPDTPETLDISDLRIRAWINTIIEIAKEYNEIDKKYHGNLEWEEVKEVIREQIWRLAIMEIGSSRYSYTATTPAERKEPGK